MSTTPDFNKVTDIVVKFSQHPSEANAHKHMNIIYQDVLPDHNRIFKDPAVPTEVKDDAELISTIRQIVTDELIVPAATETSLKASIVVLIQKAPFHVAYDNGAVVRRLNKRNMTQAFTSTVTSNRSSFEIRIGINHIYFDPTKVISYLNWSHFSDTPYPGSVPPAPMTAADIAAAMARHTPSATDIARAVAGAVAASTTATVASTRTSTTSTAYGSLFTFNPSSLPPDVKKRYLNKQANGLIIGNEVATPYLHGNRYYINSSNDKIFLSDGTLFPIQDLNEKGLFREPVYCENTTHAGIRQWYQTFTRYCMDHGFYVQPIWCFRKDKGGDRGFVAGNDPDDDLPERMKIPLERMSHHLFRLLSKKDMFPAGSKLPKIVQTCYGDGYKALKGILFRSHPIFYDQPSTLITSYPKQRELTMLEYFQLFQDFLQLRAFITSTTSSLSDLAELDIFIGNTKYSQFLNRVTRDERRQPSLAHKYQGTQLMETLEKFLMSADSPTRTGTNTGVSESYTRRNNDDKRTNNRFNNRNGNGNLRAGPAPIRVHHMTFSEDEDKHHNSEEDTTIDDLLEELHIADVPAQERELYHVYSACVHRIQQQPNQATSQPCIVCGGEHRFADCDVLNNNEFLRQHYIRYCQQLRRDSLARQQSFTGKAGKLPLAAAPVNFVTQELDNEEANDGNETDYEEESDFQQGRV